MDNRRRERQARSPRADRVDKTAGVLHKRRMGVGFIRDARWLGRARARAYLWLFALLNVATFAFIVGTSSGGIDRNGFLLGTDFLSFWTTGRMLHEGGAVYDAAAHTATQREFFAQEGAYTAFFYPPPFLLFCYPLGFLPYFPALAAWLTVTGVAYLATARAWLRASGLAQPLLLLAAAFPPVLITVTHGQSSFLAAALLGGGALLVRSRPLLAGICFGLAVIKPQFGLLVPLVLLLTGEWRTIAAAAATTLALATLATLAFGADVWLAWLAVGSEAQAAMEQGAVGFGKMQSPFAAALLLGAPLGVAYGVQGVVAAIVVAAIGWASWRRRYSLALGAAMLAGAPLLTPFVLDYDLVLLAFPLIFLAGTGFRPWEKATAATAFAAAAFARPLALTLGVPIMPLVLAALFAVLVRRAAEQPA